MSKQIKIGFDRSISPQVDTLEPLYDITGLPLRNENGEPLYTEETAALSAFYASKKSLPIHDNNSEKSPVKVIEQFPETSQVSSSLLGVPRDEKQLGLFSDVSTYGFNNNIWEFFTSYNPRNPIEWLYRRNKTYGNRFNIQAVEVAEEQAIALKAFPVPWTFPYGPTFSDQGLYNENLYEQYINFILLGRTLYDIYFASEDETIEKFAVQNFLAPGYVEYDRTRNEILYNETIPIEQTFEEIEKWTMAWIKLRDGVLFLPNGLKPDIPAGFDITTTRPGYSSSFGYFGQIQSRKAYRYQPGRISGFTFGLRSSSDQASLDNVIEWGAANETDEYVFQVRGPNFSIVRRSTVPLPEQNLIDMGLTKDDQYLVNPSNPYATGKFDPDTGLTLPPQQLYETVITRDYFNNDKLDGNGPSGYILTVEQVTMYKIEFSWYGAIGAKFYAYVPTGNGDARWVLMHTLIIENKIGQPCLNDPYFKFKYTLKIRDTSNLVAPQFVYKYGASYYIDGGDQGAYVNYSTVSDTISASPLYTRSALGIVPKDFILNSDGEAIRNKKDVVPESISVTTDNPIRLDIMECEGCPGFGHHYAPSLHNGIAGNANTFTINADGKTIYFTNQNYIFTDEDRDAKVIGDGIYSTYIDKPVAGSPNSAYIKRKLRSSDPPTPSNTYTYANTAGVVFANGSSANVRANTFNLRLSKYNSIAVCTIPLTKPNIDVNFLNPTPADGKSYADFYIGVTDKEPTISTNPATEGQLLLGGNPFSSNDVLYGEWTNYRFEQDIRGYDLYESDERYAMALQMDPQIGAPAGVDSGVCSRLSIRVSEFVLDTSFVTSRPGEIINTIENGNFLEFGLDNSILASLDGLAGGQIGIPEGSGYIASASKFVEEKAVLRFNPLTGSKYYIAVDNNALAGQTKIAFRVARVYGRYTNKTKVFSFDIYPLYVVVGMRDNSKVNNITIEEYDAVSKFAYSPEWITATNSTIEIVNSGVDTETLNRNNGIFSSGGRSLQGEPPTNYLEITRLSSAKIDKQLQQPLRPAQIRSTVFLGANETKQFELDYLFGQDRYIVTPGLYNTKATFFTVKALNETAQTQISLNFKEQ